MKNRHELKSKRDLSYAVPSSSMHLTVPTWIRERAIHAGVMNFSKLFETVLLAFVSHEPVTIRLKDKSVMHFYHGPGESDHLLASYEDSLLDNGPLKH